MEPWKTQPSPTLTYRNTSFSASWPDSPTLPCRTCLTSVRFARLPFLSSLLSTPLPILRPFHFVLRQPTDLGLSCRDRRLCASGS